MTQFSTRLHHRYYLRIVSHTQRPTLTLDPVTVISTYLLLRMNSTVRMRSTARMRKTERMISTARVRLTERMISTARLILAERLTSIAIIILTAIFQINQNLISLIQKFMMVSREISILTGTRSFLG